MKLFTLHIAHVHITISMIYHSSMYMYIFGAQFFLYISNITQNLPTNTLHVLHYWTSYYFVHPLLFNLHLGLLEILYTLTEHKRNDNIYLNYYYNFEFNVKKKIN